MNYHRIYNWLKYGTQSMSSKMPTLLK